jgi:hypothetical protein
LVDRLGVVVFFLMAVRKREEKKGDEKGSFIPKRIEVK